MTTDMNKDHSTQSRMRPASHGTNISQRRKQVVITMLLLTLSGPLTLQAATESFPCIITPSESVEVGSSVTGVLGDILVERSDSVKKGEVIARIDARVERKTVDLAALRTQDASEVQTAIVAREFAKRERNRLLLLFRKHLVSKQEFDKADTELDLAERKLLQARARAAQIREELQVAKAQLNQRVIRSPIDGIVAERYLSEGQRVRDQPLVKIIKVNPLHVEVVVPATWYQRIRQGDRMLITPGLPGFEAREGEVIIIDKTIDAASNTFRVTLKLDNPDLTIPAGARCTAATAATLPKEVP